MHDDIRTTFALRRDVYDRMKGSYREMGFGTMAELVNEAVREYLHRRRLESLNLAMARARVADLPPDY